MRSIRGEVVDRPPVCFYEINGYDEDPDELDPFNIYSHPSWKPVIDLARERSDRIVIRRVDFLDAPRDPLEELSEIKVSSSPKEPRSSYPGIDMIEPRLESMRRTVKTIRWAGLMLVERTRWDSHVNTLWTEEHLLKDTDDLKAYLSLPVPCFGGIPDVTPVLQAEADLGDTGIVMIDTPDPLCQAAALFDLGTFTVIALTEPGLFHQLLERFASLILPQTEAVAKALPGRLWRIYGPEYASPPYLPPYLFREYAVRYDRPMVEAIQRYGGYARIHCHGKVGAILDDIASTGCTGLDPIEPPPQGNVELAYVRERYGEQMTLFGNLEASDLETLPTEQFTVKIERALREGTQGKGRGFVLMPSACPYGRVLPDTARRNYEKMVEIGSSPNGLIP